VVQGHGVRERQVVVWAACGSRATDGACWVRRYCCTACRAVLTVLPRGVMPRYLYSAAAIAMALALTAPPSAGDGLTDAEAYERQGMYSVTRWLEAAPYRWRSLDRWRARALAAWWSGADTVEGLVVSWQTRAAGPGRGALLEAAVNAHALWGRAM